MQKHLKTNTRLPNGDTTHDNQHCVPTFWLITVKMFSIKPASCGLALTMALPSLHFRPQSRGVAALGELGRG